MSVNVERMIIRNLERAQQAKLEHKASNQCEAKSGRGCTGCHFWSGAIAALSELTGQPGVID
jgi:hypothetical protein